MASCSSVPMMLPNNSTPEASLEIQELAEISSSDEQSEEEDDGNEAPHRKSKRTSKFPAMNLSKFRISSSERSKKAEDIIERFMSKTGKQFQRVTKRKSKGNDNLLLSKKRRIDRRNNKNVEQCTHKTSAHVEQQRLGLHNEGDQSVLQLEEGHDVVNLPTESMLESAEQQPLVLSTAEQQLVSQNEEGKQTLALYTEAQEQQENPQSKLPNNDGGTDGYGSLAEFGRQGKELDLHDIVKQDIGTHPSDFHVKLYVLSSPSQSDMTTAVNSIIKPEQMIESTNITRNFIIFFYRDGNGPEIFVMTSGQAFRHFTDRKCPLFAKKIAKRLLQFKTIELETRNVTGDTRQTRKLFLPTTGGSINIWDLIDVVVHRFKAYPREDSSIYNLECFQSNREKKKPISFSISPLSVMVNHSLTIQNMQEMIAHFCNIDKGQTTKLYRQKDDGDAAADDDEEGEPDEDDDKQFEQMEHVQEEHSKHIQRQLKTKLQKRIDRSLEKGGENEDIQLSMHDLEEWLQAESFVLFLKGKRKPVETWDGKPPMLSDVIKSLKRDGAKIENELSINFDWLTENVKLATKKNSVIGKRSPITDFLVGVICSSDSSPYFFWHGKWLMIKMEYHSIVAENFTAILEEHEIKSTDVLPLPWVSSSTRHTDDTETTTDLTSEHFQLKTLVEVLKTINVDEHCDDDTARMLLKKLGDVTEDVSGVACRYNRELYQQDNKGENVALLFLRLHSKLSEGMYNATYILLDKLLSLSSPTQQLGYIVGDRILSHKIEMFDILMYDETNTYLVHVKEGFDQNIRDVCSQIRNSADILLRDMTSQSSHSIVDTMWDELVKEEKIPKGGRKSNSAKPIGMKNYKKAIRTKVKSMDKSSFVELFDGQRQIVYVLASRNTRKDGSILSNPGDSVSVDTALENSSPCRGHLTKIIELLVEEEFLMPRMGGGHCLKDKFRLSVKREDNFVSTMIKAVGEKMAKQNQKQISHQAVLKQDQKSSSIELSEKIAEWSGNQGSGDAIATSQSDYKDSGTGTMTVGDNSQPRDSGMPQTLGSVDGTRNTQFAVRGHSPDIESAEMEEENEKNMNTDSDTDQDSSSDFEEHIEIKQFCGGEKQPDDDYDYKPLKIKVFWKMVYKVLKENMPKTNSTIAQLELLGLFSYFRNHQIGPKKFQLKICFLSTSTEHIEQNLKEFLKLDNFDDHPLP